jgi:hypothetical protein
MRASKEAVMTRRSRWLSIVGACVVAVAVSAGSAGAADKAKVNQATQRVEEGARSIGYGEFGDGFKDLFVGLGQTIVEGTKYSALTIGEFLKKTFGN